MRMWLLLIACAPCSSRSSEGAADVVSALNARFRAGRPSDDPALAGVVVHATDSRDQQLIKGLGPGGMVWRPETTAGQIVSCSMMNAQLPFLYTHLPFLYTHGQAGFVLSSAAVKHALLCSYPWDAGSVSLICPADWRSSDTCVPGCNSEANQGLVPRLRRAFAALQCSENPRKCKPAELNFTTARIAGRFNTFKTGAIEYREIMAGKRAFARTRNSSTPSRVWPSLSLTQTMHLHKKHLHASKLRPQYNELVLAADILNSLLPSAIEAVYVRPCTTMINCRSKGQGSSGGAAAHAGAIAVQASLLRHLNRTAQELPLLELNTSNLVEPFRLVAA